MAQWKVQLTGEDATFSQLQSHNSRETQVMRDGINWFLESSEFELITDHMEVKEKAKQIVSALVASGKISPAAANIGFGAVYRIHYDNSKTVYRD